MLRDTWSQEVLGVWVRLDLATTGQEASCWLVARGVNSFDFSEEASRTTDGSIPFNADDIDHISGGSYSVMCRLPASARVLSVRWDEQQ
jgi:hypothetical protein